jgi:hypothetical protein
VIGDELEQLLRRIVREELAKLLAGEGAATNGEDDDRELRERAATRAAAMRRARAGGAR